MNRSCIFCKIVLGEIPSIKIAETTKSYAFMDIAPTAKGHVVIIPKYHGEKLHNLPDEHLADLLPLAKKIAIASKLDISGLDGEGYNLLQNNGSIAHQVVPHVHFHLIPKRSEDTGLQVGWPQPKLSESLEEIAAEITKNLA
ncbi:adenosine 5'-monophosphoramidase [Starmerella bacillaris]|uniref:Adenosine 5'-monophosphoramidase n=1 Tax=Starmerella bacillaris TaxID=1247836 RepID=A0AAV5RHZ7_STABA|nr:adenosine 5'-monophosphoramidase [Starmerella bacillaris]